MANNLSLRPVPQFGWFALSSKELPGKQKRHLALKSRWRFNFLNLTFDPSIQISAPLSDPVATATRKVA